MSEFTGRRVQAMDLSGVPLGAFVPPDGTRLLGLCADTDALLGLHGGRLCVGDFDLDCVHVLDVMALRAPGPGSRGVC